MKIKRSYFKTIIAFAVLAASIAISPKVSSTDTPLPPLLITQQLTKDSYYVSIPLDLNSYELGETAKVGNPITMNPAGCVTSIFRWNSTAYEKIDYLDNWGWWPATGSENFTKLEPGRGYVFSKKTDSCIVEFKGSLPTQPVNVSLKQGYNLASWHSANPVVIAGKENVLKTTPENCVTEISETDPQITTAAGFKTSGPTRFLEYKDGIWTPLQGSEAFASLVPGKGYTFITNKDCVFSSGEVVPEPVYKTIQVTSPNGGQSWQVGSTQQIAWSMTGIKKVKLMLLWSDAGGNYTYQDITTLDYGSPTDSAGSPYVKPADNKYTYTWSIPSNQAIRSNYRIEARSVDSTLFPSNTNGMDYDVTDADFSIVAPSVKHIQVASPNGGQSWQVGTPQRIVFNMTGIKKIKITLLWNEPGYASSFTQVIDSIDYTNSAIPVGNNYVYDWNVPSNQAIRSNYRIEVRNMDSSLFPSNTNGEDYDVTDADFSIVSSAVKSIQVISPNGGEQWVIGKTYDIKWLTNNINSVTQSNNVIAMPVCAVDLHQLGVGYPIKNLIASYSFGSYPWTIPTDIVSGQYKILVRCNEIGGFTTYSDMSDNYFNIVKSEVAKPDLIAESARIDLPHYLIVTIKNIGSADYVYSSSTLNDLFYWSDLTGGLKGGAGNSRMINIAPGKSEEFIAANSEFTPGTHKVQITVDPLNHINELNEVNNVSTFNVEVPVIKLPDLIVESANIKLVDDRGVMKNIITATVKNIGAGAYYYTESSVPKFLIWKDSITGQSKYIGNYMLADIAPGQSREYTIDNTGSNIGSQKISVTVDSDNIIPESNNDNNIYNIAETSAITVVSPNGGEQLVFGNTFKITWSRNWMPSQANGLVTVAIKKGDANPVVLAQNVSDANGYSFTPSTSAFIHGYDYKIIVTSNGYGSNLSDESDKYFSIDSSTATSAIKVVSPNGGEILKRDVEIPVIWSTAGDYSAAVIDTQKVSLYKSGVFVKNISPILPIAFTPTEVGRTNWKIMWTPDSSLAVGSDYKIRVSNSLSGFWDESDGYFSIYPLPSPTPTPTPTPTPGTCILPDGTLVKLPGDPRIYIIKDCKKVWIRTAEEFISSGYKWSDVTEVTASTVGSIPDDTTASTTSIPEGSIIQVTGDQDVYIVKYVGSKKFKRLILSPSVFRSYGHLKWENIIKVDRATLDSFTTSSLVQGDKSGKIYSLVANGDAGVRRLIRDLLVLQRLGFDTASTYVINETDENSYAQGEDLQ